MTSISPIFLPPACRICRAPGDIGISVSSLRTFTIEDDMHEATVRQKRAAATLIAKVAAPVTADEASRLIGRLRREEMAFPALLEQIVEADHAGDRDRLGRLLRRAQTRIRHGGWLLTLRRLGINPRRAQRLMAR